MGAGCNQDKLLFEKLFDKALHFFRTYRIPFFSAIVFGFLAHGFVFTNKYINHDEVYNLFGKGATVDSGRWGLGALDSIFPNYSMPWIYGILTICLVAVSACLILHTFSVRNRVLQTLLAGSMVVFPVWVSVFSFMFTSSAYATAFLTAALSVFLLRQRSPFCWVFALGCGIFSVSIYQAYIAIIAGLLVLALIQDLLSEEDLLPVLRRGFFYVGFLILTLGLYYIATQAILVLKDVTFNEYADERDSFNLAQLLRNIGLAYSNFFQVLETGSHALFPTLFSRRMHRICMIACAVMLYILFFTKRMKPARILFLLALILVFPLSVCCMYLFTLEAAIHTMVLCGFLVVYVPPVILADQCISCIPEKKCLNLLRKIALNALFLGLSVIVVCNTYFANEAYLALHLQYENTYAFYSSLLSDLRMHPEFDEDTRLAVIGRWDYPDYFFRKFDFTFDLFGHLNCTPAEYSMDRFMEYYIGLSIPFASNRECKQIQHSEEYAQMPVYPYYGSIRMIDDTLVVKLS